MAAPHRNRGRAVGEEVRFRADSRHSRWLCSGPHLTPSGPLTTESAGMTIHQACERHGSIRFGAAVRDIMCGSDIRNVGAGKERVSVEHWDTPSAEMVMVGPAASVGAGSMAAKIDRTTQTHSRFTMSASPQDSSCSRAFASLRSALPEPSVNHP